MQIYDVRLEIEKFTESVSWIDSRIQQISDRCKQSSLTMSSSSSAAAFQEMIRKSTTGALDRAKLVLGRGENSSNNSNDEPDGIVSETTPAMDRLEELSSYCPQLTFQQRLIGFAASFSLGCELRFCSRF
jgi:hypothetical protein